MTEQQQQITDMNARLIEASEAYYKKNQPIMSDAEFDKLERQLKQLVDANPEFKALATILASVGTDLTAKGGRIPHARPMLSIENQYTEQDIVEWYNKLPEGTACCLEPKFDGISVSLVYENGKLVRALTRGDGKGGEDITAQVNAVNSIPKKLTKPLTIEVRGELVMMNSTLERLNKAATAVGGKIYSSTRNLTGGTMKLKVKDTSVITDREILIMPWDVLGDDLPDSGFERLTMIHDFGFNLPLGTVVVGDKAVAKTLKRKIDERIRIMRDQLSLETDGVVIKVDSHKLRQKLGVANKYTNYQTCFKPQSASGTTYLRAIEWQIGRTGKLSPVAVCDPVVLAGAKVEHASLNNITWIREKGLKIGAKVEMLRSGDVIPQIVRVLDEGDEEIMPPAVCPECSTVLEESDEGGAGVMTHRCP